MKLRLFVVFMSPVLLAWPGAVWTAIRASVRRKDPRPDRMPPPAEVAGTEAEFPGYYLATWKIVGDQERGRFIGWDLLRRGQGRLIYTDRGLLFYRKGTRRPIWLPYEAMRAIRVVLSERRRIRGRMAMEVDWEVAGWYLRSVFVLSGGVSATVGAAQWLEARVQTG